MIDTPTSRLLLIASICLPLTARPGLASEGSVAPAEQGELTPVDTPPDEAVAEAVPDEDEIDGVGAPSPNHTPIMETQPISMDHSGWPVIVVTPADGSVTHNPGYMGNPPMGDDIVTTLNAPDPVWQVQEALAGAKAGNLNGENLLDLGAQPFIGLARIFIIPARAVFERPWAEVTSP